MKDEKFCFKKGTGLIALVGIVLVLAVFAMNTATSQQQTTGAKAFGSCPNSSLGDPTGMCPANWIARDANGIAYTDSAGKTCCYLGVNYTGTCPSGSSPDTLGVCPASRKTGVFITRKSDNQQVQCCNFVGTVQNTPAPVAQNSPRPTSPVVQADDYCKSIGLYNVPADADGMTPRFVNDYFKLNCSSPDNFKAVWNGNYLPSVAKCYTRTGVCASNPNCASTSCLVGYDSGKNCVYKPEPDMTKCLADPAIAKAYNPPVCPPNGEKVYLYGGPADSHYYLQAGKICTTKTGARYCCNKALTVAEANAAGLTATTTANCPLDPKKFGWGPMKVQTVNAIRGTKVSLYTCYQMNAANGKACNANKEVAQEFCQCYVDFKGDMKTETCQYAKTLSL